MFGCSMPGFPPVPASPSTSSNESSSSSGLGPGPRFGTVPHLLDLDLSDADSPVQPTGSGWGIIDDGGAAPAIAQVLLFPEGSERALAPVVHFYVIKEDYHRLWQANLHPDRPVVAGHTCSFLDFLVYTVKMERDSLLTRCEAAEKQEQTLQQTIVGL